MKKNSISICFRCDFGPQYGLGHLMRCIALAEAFGKYSRIQTYCLTNSYNEKFQGLLNQSGMQVITFSEKTIGLKFELEKYLKNSEECITIFDHYGVTFQQMNVYKKKYPHLVAIDDLADRRFHVDLIINHNIDAENLAYQTTNKTVFLLGNQYGLLRNNILKPRKDQKKDRIFMSFGGGDVFSRIKTFLGAFQQIDQQLTHPLHIDFVIAANNKRLRDIQLIMKGLDKIKFTYISNSYDLSSTMSQACFAITAAGSMSFELAALGIPQITFILDTNQEVTGQKINKIGFGKCPGYINKVTHNEFTKLFNEFLTNESMKEKMSETGRNFIDGKGKSRVIKEIIKLYNLAI